MKIKEMIENFKKKIPSIIAIHCPKCGSFHIAYGENYHEIATNDFGLPYEQYDVRCKNCGNIGKISETWEHLNTKKGKVA